MKFKNQNRLLDLIKKTVDERTQKESIAVFDADGTLWQEDVNQILLDYQIELEKEFQVSSSSHFKEFFQGENQEFQKNKQAIPVNSKKSFNFVESFTPKESVTPGNTVTPITVNPATTLNPRPVKAFTGAISQEQKKRAKAEKQSLNGDKQVETFQDLLSDYYQKDHRHELCQQFLKKQAGLSFDQFEAVTEKALEKTPLTVFPFQRELLSYLKKQKVKIVVVTASIQWLVEIAVKKYNLPVDQVIGSRSELYLSKNSMSGKVLNWEIGGRENSKNLSVFLSDKIGALSSLVENSKKISDKTDLEGESTQNQKLEGSFLLKSNKFQNQSFSENEKQKLIKQNEGEIKKIREDEIQKWLELTQEERYGLKDFDLKKKVWISDRLVRPSTSKDSKAEVFLQEYKKSSCLLAGGNTLSDLSLMELAELSFMVHSSKKGEAIFSAEQKMKKHALAKNWILFERV